MNGSLNTRHNVYECSYYNKPHLLSCSFSLVWSLWMNGDLFHSLSLSLSLSLVLVVLMEKMKIAASALSLSRSRVYEGRGKDCIRVRRSDNPDHIHIAIDTHMCM